MKIEQIKTSDLIPYARNSRSHSEVQVAQIAGSIREFGFTNPVLIDADNGIIAGHGRVMAAGKLGLDKVPCIQLRHLTETQKRAYIIADNKLALNAGWDEDLLGLELADLREADFDLNLTGFDGDEIEAALNPDGPDFQPGTEDDQGNLDEKTPIECPHCHKFFTT
jgi:ParB-like chromosome segregation protein Spo0J